MNNFFGMDVLTSFYQLINVVACLNLMKSLTSTNKVRKRLIVTNIKHDINIFFIFKIAIKAYNILIIERSVNFYFTS